jgi:hypothetical protein
MRPVTIFPDIELWLTAYLRGRDELAGVYVGRNYPSTDRAKTVTVRRQGGSRRSPVTENASVGVNVWAADDLTANELAATVRACIEEAVDTAPIEDVSVGGPTEITDEKKARRYFTANLIVRGTAPTT